MDTPQNGRRNGKSIDPREADAAQSGMRVMGLPESGRTTLDIEVLRAKLVLKNLGPSFRLNRARANGKKWANLATGENIAHLPERQMMAFLWFYWGGLQCPDIAELMGVTDRAVEKLLAEARKSLERIARVVPG